MSPALSTLEFNNGADMTKKFLALVGALSGFLFSATAPVMAQQAFPDRPLRLLVPFSPGGSTDVYARKFAKLLGDNLGQVVVVENKDGGAGSIAGSQLKAAKPDGYTVMIGTSSNVTTGPATNAVFKYDPRKDFSAIGILGVLPMVVIANPSVPANNMKEFVSLIKQNPDKYMYGSGGVGGVSHLAGELFKDEMGGLKLPHVPYKGSGPVIQDILAGRVQVLFDNAVPNLPHYRAGKEKILVALSEKRLKVLPNVPTTVELGYPDLTSSTVLFFLAPAKTPEAVLSKIREASQQVIDNPQFSKDVTEMGVEKPDSVDAVSAEKYIREDMAKWANIAKKIGLKLE